MPRCEFKTRAKQGNNLRDNEKVLVVRGEEESMVWKETGLHPENQRLPIERALFAKVQPSDSLKRLTHPTFGDSLVLPNLSNPLLLVGVWFNLQSFTDPAILHLDSPGHIDIAALTLDLRSIGLFILPEILADAGLRMMYKRISHTSRVPVPIMFPFSSWMA
jgi:hypothetical protein